MNIPIEVLDYVFKLHGCKLNGQMANGGSILFDNPSGAPRYMMLGFTFCVLKDPARPDVILHQETDQPSSFHALVRCLGDQYEVIKQ